MTRSAQLALNRKLQLERHIHRDVRSIFLELISNSAKPFIDVRQYEDDIYDSLLGHYRRVFKEFGTDYQKSGRTNMTDGLNNSLRNDADKVFKIHASRQARIITDTNQNQLAKAKRVARAHIEELQKINPDITFSKQVSNLYSVALLKRIPAIATYETQWSAEFSKAAEAVYITSGKIIEVKARREGNLKRWDAVGDDLMRDWHADADSELVELEEPFIVNDEELMFPGDTSLGATASNIINCRCSVSYQLDAPGLVDLTQFPELTEKIFSLSDFGKGSDHSVESLKQLAYDGLDKAISIASKLGDSKSIEKLNLIRKKLDAEFSKYGTSGYKKSVVIALNNERRAIQKSLLGVDSLKGKKPSFSFPKSSQPSIPKPVQITSIGTSIKPVVTNVVKSEPIGVLATTKFINTIKGIVEKTYKLAKSNNIGVDEASSLIAELGNVLASHPVGKVPRKALSSIGTKAKKLSEQINKGPIVSSAKKTITSKVDSVLSQQGTNDYKWMKIKILDEFKQAAKFNDEAKTKAFGQLYGDLVKQKEDGTLTDKIVSDIIKKFSELVEDGVSEGLVAVTSKITDGFTTTQKFEALPDKPIKKGKFETIRIKAEKEGGVWEARYKEVDQIYGVTKFELPVLAEREVKAIGHYKSTSDSINGYLRYKSLNRVRFNEQIEDIVEDIHSVIRRTEVKETQTVWRGISDLSVAESMKKLKVGDKVENTSLTSTSTQKGVARSFDRGFLMEIELPKGTKALFADPTVKANGKSVSHMGEHEVILPNGGHFIVTEKGPNYTKFRYVGPSTFSQPNSVSQIVLIPKYIKITERDIDVMSVSPQEWYGMLVASGMMKESEDFINDYFSPENN
jgi:hypothetical protein